MWGAWVVAAGATQKSGPKVFDEAAIFRSRGGTLLARTPAPYSHPPATPLCRCFVCTFGLRLSFWFCIQLRSDGLEGRQLQQSPQGRRIAPRPIRRPAEDVHTDQ